MGDIDTSELARALGLDQTWANRLSHALKISFTGHTILKAYLNGKDISLLDKEELKEKCDLVIVLAGA